MPGFDIQTFLFDSRFLGSSSRPPDRTRVANPKHPLFDTLCYYFAITSLFPHNVRLDGHVLPSMPLWSEVHKASINSISHQTTITRQLCCYCPAVTVSFETRLIMLCQVKIEWNIGRWYGIKLCNFHCLVLDADTWNQSELTKYNTF